MQCRFVFEALAAFAFLASAATPVAAAPPPGGVYSILDAATLLAPPKGVKNPLPNQGPISTQALMVHGTDGLLIHLRWNEISTGVETYNWTSLRDAVQLAINQGKRFEIGIVIGGAEPTWLTAPKTSGGLGARYGNFEVNASSAGTCPTFKMAAPYDPVFLAAFDDLLHKLSADLRKNRTYDKLSLIKLSGLTTTTDELRLPAVDACKSSGASKTIQAWQKLGYTPAKVEAAWKTMLSSYLKYFPDKSFSIGFIGVNAFPGINAQGNPVAPQLTKIVSARLVAMLIKDAGVAMPSHLAIGFDSLSLDVPASVASYYSTRSQMFRDVASAGARPGWQTNELEGEYPGGGAACGGTTKADAVVCTTSAQFRKMLFQGIYPQGKANTPPANQGVYMELFPQNIVAFPDAVRDAHDNLSIWNGGR